jgi:hypothetical protein
VSALEVIEQIKALPPQEKAVVVDFVQQLQADDGSPEKSIQYATAEQAKAAGDKVVNQYENVFRKLAH